MKTFTNLPANWSLQKDSQGIYKLHTGEGESFCPRFPAKPPLRHQPLVKAIGFKGRPLEIWDLTAGWGQDSWLLASLGCQVTAIEKEELVFFLLNEAFARQSKNLNTGSLKLILADSINYLKQTSKKPEVIYMDPLFGKKKKSLSTKPLRILQTLTGGNNEDTQKLLSEGLKKATNRLVMKRHRLQPPLKGPHVCSFKGRAICYDVFSPLQQNQGLS